MQYAPDYLTWTESCFDVLGLASQFKSLDAASTADEASIAAAMPAATTAFRKYATMITKNPNFKLNVDEACGQYETFLVRLCKLLKKKKFRTLQDVDDKVLEGTRVKVKQVIKKFFTSASFYT